MDNNTTSNGWAGFVGLPEEIAMRRHQANVAAGASKASNGTATVPKVQVQSSPINNAPVRLPPPVPPPRRSPPPPPLTAPMLATMLVPPVVTTPAPAKTRGRKKGPLSDEEKSKRAATRAKNAKSKGKGKAKAAKKEGEPVAKKKGKKSKTEEGGKSDKMSKPKRTKVEKIVAHGGTLFGDIATVGGAALLGARLDDMISARPLGQDPSTILLVAELAVTVFAVVKRKRKVAHYAALATAGTAAGKLARASKKTPSA